MTSRPLFVGMALGPLVLGFALWRLQSPAPPTLIAGILVDRSDSMQDPCAALDYTAALMLQLSADRRGSTLAVFVTGNPDSGNQPLLLDSREAPTRRRLLKGSQLLQLERAEFVNQLKKRCGQQPLTRTSPIYSALQAAVTHLRGVDAPASDRRLSVVSDLRETVEPHIKKALVQPLGAKFKGPLPIDNAAVKVVICGYAQTRDRQSLQNERLIEVWSQLFTDPSLVKFEPFCSFPTMASTSSQRQ